MYSTVPTLDTGSSVWPLSGQAWGETSGGVLSFISASLGGPGQAGLRCCESRARSRRCRAGAHHSPFSMTSLPAQLAVPGAPQASSSAAPGRKSRHRCVRGNPAVPGRASSPSSPFSLLSPVMCRPRSVGGAFLLRPKPKTTVGTTSSKPLTSPELKRQRRAIPSPICLAV